MRETLRRRISETVSSPAVTSRPVLTPRATSAPSATLRGPAPAYVTASHPRRSSRAQRRTSPSHAYDDCEDARMALASRAATHLNHRARRDPVKRSIGHRGIKVPTIFPTRSLALFRAEPLTEDGMGTEACARCRPQISFPLRG